MTFRVPLALLLLGCAARPQQPPELEPPGSIVAKINLPPLADQEGVPVHLSGPNLERTATTDACGMVVFDSLPDGTYTVFAEREGKQGTAKEAAAIRGQDSTLWLDPPSREGTGTTNSGSPQRCSPPTPLAGPNPSYTWDALQRRVQGCVVAKCRIDTAGVVRDCRVVQSLPLLTDPAVAAIRKRRYRPMICDGKPIEIDYKFTMYFRMPR
jgi:TonB family protein